MKEIVTHSVFLFYRFRTLLVIRISVLLILLSTAARGQAPTWQNVIALQQEKGSSSAPYHSAIDDSGHLYLVGAFEGTVSFGNTTLASTGEKDIFIAQWNTANNSFTWAQRAGGEGSDVATAVAVSGTSVYVAGSFSSATANFGSDAVELTGSPLMGDTDAFVTKLTDTGDFIWTQKAGGTGIDYAKALVVNGTSVYVTGAYISAEANFGDIILTASMLTTNNYEIFIAKLTDSGTTSSFRWAEKAGGYATDIATAIAVNGTSVYVTGYFYSTTAMFGDVILKKPTTNDYDVFLTKLTDEGTTTKFIWTQQIGGGIDEYAAAIVVSGNNVYVAGSFSGPSVNFGQVVLYNLNGTTNIYVAKLVDAGPTSSFSWVQQAGGNNDDFVGNIAVSGNSLYVVGSFQSSTADFGNTTLVNSRSRNSDIYVAKLTDMGATGTFIWAQQAGGLDEDYAETVALHGSTIYVCGSTYSSSTTFGNHTITNPDNKRRIYLASIANGLPLATKPLIRLAETAVYPNPTHSTVTVVVPAVSAPTQVTFTLLDALGKIVAVRTGFLSETNPSCKLNLNGLAPGMYMVRVQAGSNQVMHRLIIN